MILVIIVLQLINLTWKIVYPVNTFSYNVESTLLKEKSGEVYKNLSGDPFLKSKNQSLNQAFSIDVPPTSLSLRLYGIRYSDSGQLDAAILGFDPANQRLYKTNEVIADDIILEFIDNKEFIKKNVNTIFTKYDLELCDVLNNLLDNYKQIIENEL